MPEELRAARLRVVNAEEALYACLHSQENDAKHCRELAEEVRIARDELLDKLAKLWPKEIQQDTTATLAHS